MLQEHPANCQIFREVKTNPRRSTRYEDICIIYRLIIIERYISSPSMDRPSTVRMPIMELRAPRP